MDIPLPREGTPEVPRLAGNCIKCGAAMPAKAMTRRRLVELPDGTTFGPFCAPCRKRFVEGLALAANRRARYRREYGLPLDKYGWLYAYQRGVCAICQGQRSGPAEGLVVDHDHKTELVRGLLCDRCNRGLGLFADDPALLASAIVYLTSKLPMHLTHPEVVPEAG